MAAFPPKPEVQVCLLRCRGQLRTAVRLGQPKQPSAFRRTGGAILGVALVALGHKVAQRPRRQHGRNRSWVQRRSRPDSEVDVVVIGSGFGGLACAGLLARSGRKVLVCESHTQPGGVAHSFKRQGYEFDSGPSLLSGCSSPSSPNPVRHLLNVLEEDCDWVTYPGWRMVTPEGNFDFEVGNEQNWMQILKDFGGPTAPQEWQRLLDLAKPLGEISKGVPAAALRGDLGAVQTLQRYFSRLPPLLLNGLKFQAPFSDLLSEAGVQDRFLKKWLDYLCFVLQALPADGHPSAPVAYMMSDMYTSGAVLDYPKGGMGALIDAMVRGLEKHGGVLRYKAHVDQILVSEGQAQGVQLQGGEQIWAREAVVSNASIWDTERLLPEGCPWPKRKPPECGSFMHLHLGLKAEAVPDDAPLHYSVIRDWEEPIAATGNVVIISVPSVVNPKLAPAGRHCLHAYLAATEPFEIWKDLDRKSPEYAQFKRERAQPLFEAVERAVPGACGHIDMELIGSPLTHARFNRRHAGTYGPLMPAEAGMLPGASTPIDGLLHCGDSTFPGIGVPAAVASGFSAANVLLSVEEHLEALEAMKIP